jgi:hypothetical protein
MTSARGLRTVFITVVLCGLTLLTACGGGSSPSMPVARRTLDADSHGQLD